MTKKPIPAGYAETVEAHNASLNGGCLDEREAFEAHYAKIWKERNRKTESIAELMAVLVTMRAGDEYDDGQGFKPPFINNLWQGFKAGRASLSTSKQAGVEPVAYVPIHPRSGPLWMDTFAAGRDVSDARTNRYPFMPLFAAPGAAIAAREQEATPLPKGDLSKVWQAADDVCEWLNYEVWPEKSPGLKKSVDILNEAMGRAEIRASRAASRKEAPATPQGETAGLSEVTERYCNKCGYFGPDQIHYRPNGLGECGYIARIRTQPTTVQQAQRVCGNPDCGWKGHTNRMLGSIGPLCPECGETTEENNS